MQSYIRKYDLKEEISNNIIIILEKLGFPMEELGTELYGEVIRNVIYYLNNSNNDNDIEELREELSNPFSQFYFDIARNDNDMGLKSFHEEIKCAITQNKRKDKRITEDNYKEMSFVIGNELNKANTMQSFKNLSKKISK